MNYSTLKGTIYGAACGDALGVPYLQKVRDSFKCEPTMVEDRRRNRPAGTWSDSISLMLATCDSIRELGVINPKDILDKFGLWHYTNKYACDEEQVKDSDAPTIIAITTRESQCKEDDNDSGPLLRIAPLAYFDTTYYTVSEVVSITHGYWEVTQTCVEFIYLLSDIINNRILKEDIFSILPDLKTAYRNQLHNDNTVKDIFTSALWCFTHTDTYKDCVIEAVNLGGYTNKTACLAGTIAGTYYGYDAIPTEWINILRNKEIIDSCLF